MSTACYTVKIINYFFCNNIVSLLPGHAYLQRVFFMNIFALSARGLRKGRGTSAWATASSTFATNTNTRTHAHESMYALGIDFMLLLLPLLLLLLLRAPTARADEAPTPTNIKYALHVKCAYTELHTLLYKLHICMPYIHMHTYVLAHNHTGHTQSLGSLVQRCVVCSSLCANNFTSSSWFTFMWLCWPPVICVARWIALH